MPLPSASTAQVRSPIPEWLRARLNAFPAAASPNAEAANGGLAPAAIRDGLSPEEKAAFAEIASVLGPVIGLAGTEDRRPATSDTGERGAERIAPDCIPSAFYSPPPDVTPWKQAEAEHIAARQKAEEASRQKSDFLARVSHEIRTPLNGIIGFADVIIEERFGPLSNARYREYVRDIRTSGEHVLSLVNDLLDIAKIEAGKVELDFATVELNQLTRECVTLMQPAATQARIILRTSLASDLPGVRADARTIRQVILNILSNAVKFTGAGGQVIVSTGRAEDGIVLRVRDTGDGMSQAELVKAMEPFRQLGTAPLSDRTGTGLGLPLTKALVEANRASFAISSAKGEGTIVKVGFPPTSLVTALA